MLLKPKQLDCQELYLQEKFNKPINDTVSILALSIILAIDDGISLRGDYCRCIICLIILKPIFKNCAAEIQFFLLHLYGFGVVSRRLLWNPLYILLGQFSRIFLRIIPN